MSRRPAVVVLGSTAVEQIERLAPGPLRDELMQRVADGRIVVAEPVAQSWRGYWLP